MSDIPKLKSWGEVPSKIEELRKRLNAISSMTVSRQELTDDDDEGGAEYLEVSTISAILKLNEKSDSGISEGYQETSIKLCKNGTTLTPGKILFNPD